MFDQIDASGEFGKNVGPGGGGHSQLPAFRLETQLFQKQLINKP